MNRALTCAAAFATAVLCAAPALAGGRGVVICPVGYATSFDARGNAICETIRRVGPVVAVRGDAGRQQARLLCPYPYRPSDTVFSGGSGYVIKDDVRRANGCL